MLMRVRHLALLLFELLALARFNRLYWPLILVLLFCAIGATIVLGQTAAPFIYTLF
jgi:hypothetical protein